jgi:molecular chaperone DnaJ
VFKRDSANILSDAKVPLSVALLGGKVRIPTVDGEVELTISPGTQPGERQIMRKKGAVRLRGSDRGDQIVTIKVEMPKNLTAKQINLLKEAFNVQDKDDADKKAPKSEKKKADKEDKKKKEGFFDRFCGTSEDKDKAA